MDEFIGFDGVRRLQKRTRVGRGIGSGSGKTSGRGHKGDGSRSGSKSRRGHEGGQKPIFRKVAKRGFRRRGFQRDAIVVTTDEVVRMIGTSGVCDLHHELGILPGARMSVRVIAGGMLLPKLEVRADYFSAGAAAAIVAAHGTYVRYH